MAPLPAAAWNEDRIKLLVGESESLRLEFKSGALIDVGPESKWVGVLSKEVSAFANAEGGTLILGLAETTVNRSKVASDINGVSKELTQERLQHLIEGNVSPYLPGIRVHRVTLESLPDRVVYVVEIPKGATAYQANDKIYYGRSEFECKALPDHEVRLRMSRGRIARAGVHFRLRNVQLRAERLAAVQDQHAEAIAAFNLDPQQAVKNHPEIIQVMGSSLVGDLVEFDLVIRNDGELTIKGPAVQLVDERAPWLTHGRSAVASLSKRYDMDGEIVYPGDERVIPGSQRRVDCGSEAEVGQDEYSVKWTVFLDNSPPSVGKVDLGVALQDARARAVTVSQ